VPEPNAFEVEIAIAKSRKYKLPSSALYPAELIQAGDETFWSEVHKLILFGVRKNGLTKGRRLLYQFTRRVDETECSNYTGISLLSTSYKNVSNILSSSSPYVNKIIEGHHCGFQCNRSTTDQIFCIHQILEKKWEYNETVYQLFIGFRKA
jgi:hypothetical protein